ncbi:hypothetical protein BHM03_00040648, partial [Ensete ventricosum]
RLVGSLLEATSGYRKLAGSLLKEIESFPGWRQGVHRKKIERLIGRLPGVVEKLARSFPTVVPPMSDDRTTQAVVVPPRLMVVPSPSYFSGIFRQLHHRRGRLYCSYSDFSDTFKFWLQILKLIGVYKYPKISYI